MTAATVPISSDSAKEKKGFPYKKRRSSVAMSNYHRVHGGRSQGSPQQLLKSRILGTLFDGARDERLMFVILFRNTN